MRPQPGWCSRGRLPARDRPPRSRPTAGRPRPSPGLAPARPCCVRLPSPGIWPPIPERCTDANMRVDRGRTGHRRAARGACPRPDTVPERAGVRGGRGFAVSRGARAAASKPRRTVAEALRGRVGRRQPEGLPRSRRRRPDADRARPAGMVRDAVPRIGHPGRGSTILGHASVVRRRGAPLPCKSAASACRARPLDHGRCAGRSDEAAGLCTVRRTMTGGSGLKRLRPRRPPARRLSACLAPGSAR